MEKKKTLKFGFPKLSNGRILPVKAVGSLKLKFYQSHTDSPIPVETCVMLTDVHLLEGIQFSLFSIHRAQKSNESSVTASVCIYSMANYGLIAMSAHPRNLLHVCRQPTARSRQSRRLSQLAMLLTLILVHDK